MIVFVPAYDAETYANLAVVSAIEFAPDSLTLLGPAADRPALMHCLAATNHASPRPLFAMSHGERDRLRCQGALAALDVADLPTIGSRSIFAYACHTATHLGREASHHGAIWWGYTGAVSSPCDHPRLVGVFARLFAFIIQAFPSAHTEEQISHALDALARQCKDAADAVDHMAEADDSINVLEAYYALHHMWDRLRVWLASSSDAVKHPEAAPPILLA